MNVQFRLVQLFVKLATGAGVGGGTDTVTEDVLLLVPFASVTVSVTEYVPAAAYECELVTPLPDVASPYVQLYVALAIAVLLLPSKLQVSPEQLDVNRATGGVVTGAAEMNAEYSSLFVVPAGTDAVVLALALRAASTWAAVAVGFTWRYNAMVPATCGVAMDVPLIVFVAVFELYHADVMFTPGALMSTQLPKLENDANPSLMSVAPTVIALGSLDGDELHAFAVLLPAATAYTTPAAVELATA